MLIDICIIAIFAIFVYNGYKNGFIKSVYSILSLVATIIVVSIFKESFVKSIAESDIGVSIGKLLTGSSADPKIVALCSEGVIYLASVAIFYVVLKFILRFTLTIIDSIASLPIIKSLNKILGLVIGGVIGGIWIGVVIGVLYNVPKTSVWLEDSVIVEYFKIIFM